MEERQTPTWAAELKTAIKAWQKADPEKRNVITIAVCEEEDGVTVNASIIGNVAYLTMGVIANMSEKSEDNPVGNILRIAAMNHFMTNAATEIDLSEDDEQDEPQNTDSHE